MKQIVSYGGGTNSTAMLIEMHRRGEMVDAIIFADTGGERPETYTHIAGFTDWLVDHGMPAIQFVRRTAKIGTDRIATTLEQECLMRNQLPGIAYGFKSCSDKWKQQPFKTWLKATGWKDVIVCIGFDAGEAHRANRPNDTKYERRFPLIEWGMDRDACAATISKSGVPLPGKSSCFFCPSSRKPEILDLKHNHPSLFERALQMESNAELTSVKGLGRRFAWADIAAIDDAQQSLEMPCGCYDG